MILVTGGAGFIGSNFILRWIKKNNESVLNFDNLTYASNLKNLSSIEDNKNYFFYPHQRGRQSQRSLPAQSQG